jgi:hypothetical protein
MAAKPAELTSNRPHFVVLHETGSGRWRVVGDVPVAQGSPHAPRGRRPYATP